MNKDVIIKMEKLLELSERGVGGEAENARKILGKMMKMYHVTMDDLKSTDKKERFFNYNNKDECTLIAQIIAYTFGVKSVEYTDIGFYKIRKTVSLALTDIQYVDISNKIKFYLDLYRKERSLIVKNILKSFVMKHNLYPQDDEKISIEDVNPEEIRAQIGMLNLFGDEKYHKQLE